MSDDEMTSDWLILTGVEWWQYDRNMAARMSAEAKRARKAEKRRRDAERTAAGQTLGRMIVASRTVTRDVQAFVRGLRARFVPQAG